METFAMTTDATLSRSHSSVRAAGALLALASVLMVAFMAFHPRAHFHGKDDFVSAFADIAMINGLVHGSLVALFAVMLYGYSVFADCPSSSHPAMRLGLIAFGLGALPIVGAAITSGFVVPEYVARYANKSAGDLEIMQHVVRLAFTIIRVCSQVGVAATLLAILIWAIAVFGNRPVLSTVGLLAGGIPVVALATGHLPMDIHGMMVFTLAQAIWGLVVGIAMMRGRLELPR
jgi:hypothetical protein